MFTISRAISNRLLPLTTIKVCGVRHEGTVDIPTISPPPPNNDLSLGPYPRTPQERIKAARKYNLIPEDYEPYPEDHGWGDYPNLPAIGAYNKDKHDDFDDVFHCRHYGEPLHRDYDMYTWERVDPLESYKMPPLYPYWKRFLIFCVASFAAPIFLIVGSHYKFKINPNWKVRDFNNNRQLYKFPPSPNDDVHQHGHH